MRTFVLVGHPLTHSFSSRYFHEKFRNNKVEAQYINLDLKDISKIRETIITQEISGLNVTIPYKEAIIPYLDNLSSRAEKIGAVNCIEVLDEKLIGHNTDVIGFRTSLERFIQNEKVSNALVFGNGGSSKAVTYALKDLGISCSVVSRSGSLNYEALTSKHIKQTDLMVNTTPLGMFPDNEKCVEIPYTSIGKNHFAFDLVYNPSETLFLKRVSQQGGMTKNGLEMLEIQAEESWAIWNS